MKDYLKTTNEERVLEGGPNIFLYDDYRIYLRDIFDHLKTVRSGFSFRLFSKIAGFASPNYLKIVIDGKRNLTNKSILRIAGALQLTPNETDFFEALVHFTQAKSVKSKQFQFERMKSCRGYVHLKGFERDQYECFSHWYNLVIREMVTLEDFKESPVWIAKRIRPQISAEQAGQALQLLLKLGLLERDNSGRLIQSEARVASAPESLAVQSFHRQMLARAAYMLDHVQPEERDLSALTFGVNAKHIDLVKRRLHEFKRNLLEEIGELDGDSEQVYQLSLQFFPLTREAPAVRVDEGDQLESP